jgi:hypothetical protein
VEEGAELAAGTEDMVAAEDVAVMAAEGEAAGMVAATVNLA